MKVEIEWAPSPNYTKGRKGRKIIAIVSHITAGTFPGCLSWMRNPQAKASAHYLVTRQGKIYQMVRDEDTSWHAGMVNKPNWRLYDGSNPNRSTIGIEHENLSGGLLTEAQYQATLWLHRRLIEKYGIPADRDHIIGHYQIDSVNRPNDPGPQFPWGRLLADLKEDENVATEAKIKVNGQIITGYILKDNRSYAPVRALAEALGAKVDWDANTRTVLISKGGK